jgi:hypothetical protein
MMPRNEAEWLTPPDDHDEEVECEPVECPQCKASVPVFVARVNGREFVCANCDYEWLTPYEEYDVDVESARERANEERDRQLEALGYDLPAGQR